MPQTTPFSTFCVAFHIFVTVGVINFKFGRAIGKLILRSTSACVMDFGALALRVERQRARKSKTKTGRLASLASNP